MHSYNIQQYEPWLHIIHLSPRARCTKFCIPDTQMKVSHSTIAKKTMEGIFFNLS